MASFNEKRPKPKARFLIVRLADHEQAALDARVKELRRQLTAQGFPGSVAFAVSRSSVARDILTRCLK